MLSSDSGWNGIARILVVTISPLLPDRYAYTRYTAYGLATSGLLPATAAGLATTTLGIHSPHGLPALSDTRLPNPVSTSEAATAPKA